MVTDVGGMLAGFIRRPKFPVCGDERVLHGAPRQPGFVRPLITNFLSTTACLHEIYVETKGKV
jgi:hypothetical protein